MGEGETKKAGAKRRKGKSLFSPVSHFTGNGSDAPKLASFRFLGSRRGMAESKYLHKSQKVAVWLYHVVGTAK